MDPMAVVQGLESPLRVVLGEDDVLLRAGIARLLGAGDADDLVRKTLAHRPHVVVVDVQMPPRGEDDGLMAALELRRLLPGIGVLVLSQHNEAMLAEQLIGDNAGGVGYLLKERVGEVSAFVEALTRVAAGGSALDPAVVDQMLGRRRRNDPLDGLTSRERGVLAAMAEGKSNVGIGEALCISPASVEKHVTSIFRKLGLERHGSEHRRVHAVLTFINTGGAGR
jgi:DNA-binding NarL/FixJ family response regulator